MAYAPLNISHINLGIGGGPLGLWDNWLQDILVEVPELVVLGAGEEDNADSLGVEGGWDVLDDLSEYLLDARIRDWRLLLEGVDGSFGGKSLEESGGWRHV